MSKEKKHHGPIPTWLSFVLNNPIRRRFDKTPQKVVEVLGMSHESVVLDFGCGPGFHVVPFARVAKNVIAVDLQAKMLEKAQRYAARNGVSGKIQFIQSDGRKISQVEDDSCDFVFVSHVYHEIDDSSKKQVLSEFRRVLKTGAKLVILENTKKMLIGPPAVNLKEIEKELAEAEFFPPSATNISKNSWLIVSAK